MKGEMPLLRTTIVVTTFLKIAEGVGNSHATIIKLVRNNRKDFEDFCSLAFEMRVNSKGSHLKCYPLE
nr:hypothetical protein BAR15_140035 [Bartonella sp. AR 15-3]